MPAGDWPVVGPHLRLTKRRVCGAKREVRWWTCDPFDWCPDGGSGSGSGGLEPGLGGDLGPIPYTGRVEISRIYLPVGSVVGPETVEDGPGGGECCTSLGPGGEPREPELPAGGRWRVTRRRIYLPPWALCPDPITTCGYDPFDCCPVCFEACPEWADGIPSHLYLTVSVDGGCAAAVPGHSTIADNLDGFTLPTPAVFLAAGAGDGACAGLPGIPGWYAGAAPRGTPGFEAPVVAAAPWCVPCPLANGPLNFATVVEFGGPFGNFSYDLRADVTEPDGPHTYDYIITPTGSGSGTDQTCVSEEEGIVAIYAVEICRYDLTVGVGDVLVDCCSGTLTLTA